MGFIVLSQFSCDSSCISLRGPKWNNLYRDLDPLKWGKVINIPPHVPEYRVRSRAGIRERLLFFFYQRKVSRYIRNTHHGICLNVVTRFRSFCRRTRWIPVKSSLLDDYWVVTSIEKLRIIWANQFFTLRGKNNIHIVKKIAFSYLYSLIYNQLRFYF